MSQTVFGPVTYDITCEPTMRLDAHRGFRSWDDHRNARLLCADIPLDLDLDDCGYADIVWLNKRNQHQQLTYATEDATHVLAETFMSSGAWVVQFKPALLLSGSRYINAIDVFGLYMHNHFDPLHNSGAFL